MSDNLKHLSYKQIATDESLWEAFKQGDRNAYQQLYSKHLCPLYNYGCKIIPDKAVVTDHIQDLFIDLWKYRDNLSPAINIKYYLFRALRNRIIKGVHRNKCTTYPEESEYSNGLIVLPFEQKMIENQAQSENKKRLQKAFHALSKRQKEVINLLFYEKYTYEEVAGIMSINLRSVYTLAWKSLAVLRKELGDLFIVFLIYLFIK